MMDGSGMGREPSLGPGTVWENNRSTLRRLVTKLICAVDWTHWSQGQLTDFILHRSTLGVDVSERASLTKKKFTIPFPSLPPPHLLSPAVNLPSPHSSTPYTLNRVDLNPLADF